MNRVKANLAEFDVEDVTKKVIETVIHCPANIHGVRFALRLAKADLSIWSDKHRIQ